MAFRGRVVDRWRQRIPLDPRARDRRPDGRTYQPGKPMLRVRVLGSLGITAPDRVGNRSEVNLNNAAAVRACAVLDEHFPAWDVVTAEPRYYFIPRLDTGEEVTITARFKQVDLESPTITVLASHPSTPGRVWGDPETPRGPYHQLYDAELEDRVRRLQEDPASISGEFVETWYEKEFDVTWPGH